MKLLVVTDAHVLEAKDGTHWNAALYGYDFWKRYLTVFDSVRIVARTKELDSKANYKKLVSMDGPGVEFYRIPFFRGPKDLFKRYFRIMKTVRAAYNGCDAALFRVPSPTAFMVYSKAPKGMPLACEVVYDITDDLDRKTDSYAVRTMNRILSDKLKQICKNVNGVSYVTKESIQKNYPSRARISGESSKYFEAYYSTITLSEESYDAPKTYSNCEEFTVALSCVSMENDRKGEKILIKAVQRCVEGGFNVKAILIGDGSKRKKFEKYAESLGVLDRIQFTGLLSSSQEVQTVLKKADMFVFPTQAEGLPRGIIEAMAIGLPVLSTPVGGIPEILSEKYLFDPFDADAFADEICRLIQSPSELTQMSYDNYLVAKEFSNDILQLKRNKFYEKLRLLARGL